MIIELSNLDIIVWILILSICIGSTLRYIFEFIYAIIKEHPLRPSLRILGKVIFYLSLTIYIANLMITSTTIN